MNSRIETFKSMIAADPTNSMVLFGLANEYLKAEMNVEAVATLEDYLSQADDEGAAWGMLAKTYEKLGEREKANAAFEKGIETANRHGHPSMAADFRETLDFDYSD